MRIAIVVLEDFPGSENRVKRQARALVEAGHEVRLFCAGGEGTEGSWFGVQIERSMVARRKAGGTLRRLIEYVIFPVEAFFWTLRVCRTWSPSVMQVANPPDWLVLSVVPARRRCGARIVLDLHDLMPELMTSRGGSGASRRVLESLESVSVRSADRVIATSPGFQSVLARRHPGIAPELVINAVDLTDFPLGRPGLSSAEPFVTYHGTVTRRFGVDVLVRAIALLHEQGFIVPLSVYGGGAQIREIRNLVEARQLGAVVTLHGQVSACRLPTALRGSWASIVPYLSDPFMDLAYSTKAFESAALGIPLILADIPTLRAQFDTDCAAFFESGNSISLAEAIRWTLEDRPATIVRATNAQERVVSEFDWHEWAKRYLVAVLGDHTSAGDIS